MAEADQQPPCESDKRETLADIMKRGRRKQVHHGIEDEEITFQVKTLSLSPSPQVGLLYDEAMLSHACTWDTANPECPLRLSTSHERCQHYNLVDRCVRIQAKAATEAAILTKHSKDYFELLKSTGSMDEEDLKKLSARYEGMYFNNRSFHCAMLAAGSSIEMVEQIMHGKIKCGMALVRYRRKDLGVDGGQLVSLITIHGGVLLFDVNGLLYFTPPGHHAMPQTACGYCIFNNVAVAAQHAIDKLGVSRVLIVDWDVHHGQATQQMFYDDPRVLYFSIHRYQYGEFWPNLRQSDYDSIGGIGARGYNVNVPLNETGITNDDYLAIIQQVLLPVAYQFSPELVIVSNGYDAVIGDIEGECVLTPAFYAHLVHMLKPLAGGRLCLILEGGYCLEALAECVALSLRSLLDDPCPPLEPVTVARSSVREVILQVIRVLRPYWGCLCYHDDVTDTGDLPSVFTDIQMPKQGVNFDEGGRTDYPIVGDYPTQTPELIAQFNLSIRRLIAETNLCLPPNRTCVVYDEQMRKHRCHTQKDHPERPDRVSRIYKLFESEGLLQRCKLLESRVATTEELRFIHSDSYIEEVRSFQSTPEEELAELEYQHKSLYLSQEAFECACLASGCVLNTVDEVMRGQSQNGLAIVRPPGHHAEGDHAMGFCFFNSVAIAAKYALSKYQLDRVIILDWDVHHGNGTQKAFYDNQNVLFLSLHRHNWGTFFPAGHDGCHEAVGMGKGAGHNINIPWNAEGSLLGDTEYIAAFQQIIMPVVYEFAPQVILISAGFDAAKGDPLGGCQVTPACFGHMTQMLQSLANGRLVLVLEGGYNLTVTAECMASCASVMLGDTCQPVEVCSCPSPSAVDTITAVLDTQQAYWKTLQYRVKMPSREATKRWLGHTEEDEHVQPAELPSDAMCGDVLSAAMNQLTVSEEKVCCAASTDLIDTTLTCLAAGDDGSDKAGACSDVQGNNSNNLVTGPEGDGLVDDQREMFAVMPLTWCPHLVEVQPLPEIGIDANEPCQECWHAGENWLCLTCYTVHCSRYVHSHMLQHSTMATHNMVLSYADMSVWCYGCDHYVHNAVLLPAKQAAHVSKFGVDIAGN